ncbi:MAG: CidA/LrgA family protein [Clostridiaceae bacterium]
MKLLRQSAILLLIIFIGEVLNRVFKIPIPGSVIGMIILLIALLTGIVKLSHIEEISNFLLDHLAFFFIPAGVGLLSILGIIKDTWYLILLLSLLTTIIVMAITGLIVQYLKRR